MIKACSENCLANLFPNIAAEWHPVKNNTLTPSDVTSGSGKKVWWKCVIGHEWLAAVYHRKYGHGCPKCAKIKLLKNMIAKKLNNGNSLFEIYPEIAAQWHPTKNGAISPNDVTSRSNKKVWWKCPVASDHEWQATIINRTSKSNRNKGGCPCCSGSKVVVSNCLAITNPEIVTEWHPAKNGTLTPNDITSGSGKKVWWKCKNKHEWQAKIYNRIANKSNCPICNESKGEKCVAEVLKKLKIKFKRQWRFSSCRNKRQLPFDFIVVYNKKVGLIEYQGHQHYSPIVFNRKKSYAFAVKKFKQIKLHDSIKKEWCKQHNVPLLKIPYWNFDKIKQLMENFLKIM